MNMTCIMCPLGCELTVTKKGEQILVEGNNCIRGERYAKDELSCPKRMVTTLVKVSDGVLPVKTNAPVPKNMVKQVVDEISKIHLKKGKIGDVVIKNIFNLNVDVVITGNKVKYD